MVRFEGPVKVGPWSIKVVWDKEACEASGCTAQYMGDTGWVIISDNGANHIIKDSMLHELLHAIWHQTGLKVPYPDTKKNSPGEGIITVVATALLALLRDNPELVEWLRSEA